MGLNNKNIYASTLVSGQYAVSLYESAAPGRIGVQVADLTAGSIYSNDTLLETRHFGSVEWLSGSGQWTHLLQDIAADLIQTSALMTDCPEGLDLVLLPRNRR